MPIIFAEDESDPSPAGQRACICPVCRKGLSNNVKAFGELPLPPACIIRSGADLYLCSDNSALKPCGHVVCATCFDTLVMTSVTPQCAHCDQPLDKKKATIELKREGTGFAAGGIAEGKFAFEVVTSDAELTPAMFACTAKRFDLPFQG